MAITFVGAGALAAVSSGNVSPALPAGTQADDIAIMLVRTNASNNFPNPVSANWSQWGGLVNDADMSIMEYWRRLTGDGNDTPPSFTIASGTALSNSNALMARIYVFRGCVATGDPLDGSPQKIYANTSGTAVSTNADASTVADTFHFIGICLDDDNTWASGMPPSGYTQLGTHATSTVGGDGAIHAIGRTVAASGTIAAVSVGTQSAADFWTTFSAVLKPAATVGTLAVNDAYHAHTADAVTLVVPGPVQTKFVVVGASGAIAESADGESWTLVTTTGETTQFVAIAYLEVMGRYAYSAAPASGPPIVNTSPDLSTWTDRTTQFSTGDLLLYVGASEDLNQFVAVGEAISSSNDAGATWTLRTNPFGASWINTVAWIPGSVQTWIAGAEHGKIALSSSGVTWTLQTTPNSTTTIQAFAYSPQLGMIVAACNGGVVWYSTDGGTSWTSVTAGPTSARDVAWAAELSMFVMVGNGGQLYTSYDGVTWTSRTSSFAGSDIATVAWAQNLRKFVAAGGSTKMAWSTDGINWNANTSPMTTAVDLLWTNRPTSALATSVYKFKPTQALVRASSW